MRTFDLTIWIAAILLALILHLPSVAHGGCCGGLVKKAKSVGRKIDPTNPDGVVQNGVKAAAKGVQDPLRVLRHVGAVLADTGLTGAITDPITSLKRGVEVFKKEGEALDKSIGTLTTQLNSLPKVRSLDFVHQSTARISLPSLASFKPSLANFGTSLARLKEGAKDLGEAGKVLERFVMKDIPREGKRLGRDINREAVKVGEDIRREFNNCISGGCDPFGGEQACKDKPSTQGKIDCYEKELSTKKAELARLRAPIDSALQGVKTKIKQRKNEIERELKAVAQEGI